MSRDTLGALLERVRLRLWFIPSIFAVTAGIGALVLLTIDRALADEGLNLIRFGGTADGARNVLSTVAQSMLTFTGLVFTITMLVLQLAANSLSPRVMRTFLRDRQNQVVLGLFVATFVFTLIVLSEVRSSDGDVGFVPGLSTWTAFVLLLASVAAFIYYIDHMAHAIRASTVIASIAEETSEAIDARYPEGASDDAAAPALGTPYAHVSSDRAGTLVTTDDEALLEVASAKDLFIEVVPHVGDFVSTGGPLFRLYTSGSADRSGHVPKDLVEELRGSLTFGNERTLHQDPAFGIRQLVDVATRALSPGTNDPTTAVQAIDRIHDLLRILAQRRDGTRIRRDDAGRARVVRPERSWEEFVELGFDELRLYGAAHLQVARRLRSALSDLIAVAPANRSRVLLEQRDRLDAAIAAGFPDARDRLSAEHDVEAERQTAQAPDARR